MPKLLTPRQYEKPLEDINEIRPLQLADEIQHKIEIAVCNKLPVSTKKAATGMLMKGTQQGALLAKFNKDYTIADPIRLELNYLTPTGCVSFVQKVSFVVYDVISSYSMTGLFWTDSSGDIIFWPLDPTQTTYIGFSGTDLYMKATGVANWGGSYDFYGFY